MKNKVKGKIFVGGFIFILILGLTLVFALHLASRQETSSFTEVELTKVEHDPCFSPNNDGQKDRMQMKAYFTGKPHKHVYAFLFIKKSQDFIRFLAGTSRFSSSGEAVISFDWDGTDWHGQRVADGPYDLTHLYHFELKKGQKR